ncbi:PAS domain-containing protein [Kordiimonas marina]|uniref:PAS domain-containing protein n=1 Tax=Kordiimonas marina TaxID=2872312 RepID=UPI001FF335E1|nr:PAS domain-containing protein [Kordiimonas marina]MCJ9430521.1 PAS domain-containing protein [Kordiimonas marina]
MQDADRLIDLWHTLPRQNGESLPRRSSLSIAAIAPILSHCWQMRWRNGTDFTIKLMGEKLIETWGRDLSGKNLFTALPQPYCDTLNRMVAPLFAKPCALIVTRHLKKGKGGLYEFSNLSLPMLDTDGDACVVFGMSQVTQLAPERPYSGKLSFVGGEIKSARFLDLGFGVAEADFLKTTA